MIFALDNKQNSSQNNPIIAVPDFRTYHRHGTHRFIYILVKALLLVAVLPFLASPIEAPFRSPFNPDPRPNPSLTPSSEKKRLRY